MFNNRSVAFSLWVIVLFIEFLKFYDLLHQVSDQSEFLFIITLIFATLVVGAVLVVLSSNSNTNKRL